MFTVIYRSSSKHKYIKVVQNYKQGKTCKHRFIDSFGRYDKARHDIIKEIIGEWKPLSLSKIVLEELRDTSGRFQGRGYFRKFRSW